MRRWAAKVVALMFAIFVVAVPLRADALISELLGDEACVDVTLPVGEQSDEDRCVPLRAPLVDLPF